MKSGFATTSEVPGGTANWRLNPKSPEVGAPGGRSRITSCVPASATRVRVSSTGTVARPGVTTRLPESPESKWTQEPLTPDTSSGLWTTMGSRRSRRNRSSPVERVGVLSTKPANSPLKLEGVSSVHVATRPVLEMLTNQASSSVSVFTVTTPSSKKQPPASRPTRPRAGKTRAVTP